MGYLGHWLLTLSGALIILAFMFIMRWWDKRQERIKGGHTS